MQVLNKYRLELRWEDIEYRDGIAMPKGAYFSGGAIKDSPRINDKDHLILDLTPQHTLLIPDYYQAKLEWNGVEYKDNKVYLKNVLIKGKHVNSIDVLRKTDWLLISCKGHDPKNHPYLLVYWTEVMKAEGGEKF